MKSAGADTGPDQFAGQDIRVPDTGHKDQRLFPCLRLDQVAQQGAAVVTVDLNGPLMDILRQKAFIFLFDRHRRLHERPRQCRHFLRNGGREQ